MRFFFVDYENRKNQGLNGIAKLTGKDVVKIFYSEDAQTMTFGTHRRIIESNAKFEYEKIKPEMKTLKNALDILLMDELNDRMSEDKKRENQYFIVSDDKDFDDFIQKKQNNYMIYKISEVCQANGFVVEEKATKTSQVNLNQNAKKNDNTSKASSNTQVKKKNDEEEIRKKKEQTFRSFFGKNLKNDYEEYKEDIVEAYMTSKTKQEYNNKLQQYFYNEDVSYILDKTKNFIKDWPGK